MTVSIAIPDWVASTIVHGGFALSLLAGALLLAVASAASIYWLLRWRGCWGLAIVWLTFRKTPARQWTLSMFERAAEIVARDCPEDARWVAARFTEEASKHDKQP